MSSLRFTGRKTLAAMLLVLALLLASPVLGNSALGSAASAAEPGAVFHGFVVPERGTPLPKRVRAIADAGTVCGSAEVTPVGAGEVGFYAVAVFSADMREGCPATGGTVRFVLVYGMIDEGILVGERAAFVSGEVRELHLIRAASDARLALP